MGFRFRKSFGVGPFRATISKSGISTSFGVKGARVTKKANGNVSTTIGIPGSGLSYVKEYSGNKKMVNNNNKEESEIKNKYMDNYKSVSNYQNYTFYQDPQIEGARTKPPFLSSLSLVLLSLFILFMSTAFLAFEKWFLFACSVIGVIVLVSIKSNKWNKNYQLLKNPVEFEKWQDIIKKPEVYDYLPKGLTKEQLTSYASIYIFCNGEDKKFTPFDVNSYMGTTISSYMFNTLHDFGYLLKHSSEEFSLNMDRANDISYQYQKALEERKHRYDIFLQGCEVYNNNARNYNLNLYNKRGCI